MWKPFIDGAMLHAFRDLCVVVLEILVRNRDYYKVGARLLLYICCSWLFKAPISPL